MNSKSGIVQRGLLSAIVLSGLVLALTWSSSGSQQQPAGVEAFLEVVDVDGDGVHTPGDRAVLEWWLTHGGNAATAQANAVETAGVQSVRSFFDSPAAQLNP